MNGGVRNSLRCGFDATKPGNPGLAQLNCTRIPDAAASDLDGTGLARTGLGGTGRDWPAGLDGTRLRPVVRAARKLG